MFDIKIAPNFRLSEFLVGNPDAVITEDQKIALLMLANRLQVIRDIYGPIMINSGLRTPEHNKEVGGSPGSLHLKGMAADIVVAGCSPKLLQLILKNWSGGLGSYATFTHVDIRENNARW